MSLQYKKSMCAFLSYYSCEPITCRPRTKTDKGKVESGIKYVKNNFLKGLDTKDYFEAKDSLRHWKPYMQHKAFTAQQGKYQKMSLKTKEKAHLTNLPIKRYELLDIQKRTVNAYAHIKYNVICNAKMHHKCSENCTNLY